MVCIPTKNDFSLYFPVLLSMFGMDGNCLKTVNSLPQQSGQNARWWPSILTFEPLTRVSQVQQRRRSLRIEPLFMILAGG